MELSGRLLCRVHEFEFREESRIRRRLAELGDAELRCAPTTPERRAHSLFPTLSTTGDGPVEEGHPSEGPKSGHYRPPISSPLPSSPPPSPPPPAASAVPPPVGADSACAPSAGAAPAAEPVVVGTTLAVDEAVVQSALQRLLGIAALVGPPPLSSADGGNTSQRETFTSTAAPLGCVSHNPNADMCEKARHYIYYGGGRDDEAHKLDCRSLSPSIASTALRAGSHAGRHSSVDVAGGVPTSLHGASSPSPCPPHPTEAAHPSPISTPARAPPAPPQQRNHPTTRVDAFANKKEGKHDDHETAEATTPVQNATIAPTSSSAALTYAATSSGDGNDSGAAASSSSGASSLLVLGSCSDSGSCADPTGTPHVARVAEPTLHLRTSMPDKPSAPEEPAALSSPSAAVLSDAIARLAALVAKGGAEEPPVKSGPNSAAAVTAVPGHPLRSGSKCGGGNYRASRSPIDLRGRSPPPTTTSACARGRKTMAISSHRHSPHRSPSPAVAVNTTSSFPPPNTVVPHFIVAKKELEIVEEEEWHVAPASGVGVIGGEDGASEAAAPHTDGTTQQLRALLEHSPHPRWNPDADASSGFGHARQFSSRRTPPPPPPVAIGENCEKEPSEGNNNTHPNVTFGSSAMAVKDKVYGRLRGETCRGALADRYVETSSSDNSPCNSGRQSPSESENEKPAATSPLIATPAIHNNSLTARELTPRNSVCDVLCPAWAALSSDDGQSSRPPPSTAPNLKSPSPRSRSNHRLSSGSPPTSAAALMPTANVPADDRADWQTLTEARELKVGEEEERALASAQHRVAETAAERSASSSSSLPPSSVLTSSSSAASSSAADSRSSSQSQDDEDSGKGTDSDAEEKQGKPNYAAPNAHNTIEKEEARTREEGLPIERVRRAKAPAERGITSTAAGEAKHEQLLQPQWRYVSTVTAAPRHKTRFTTPHGFTDAWAPDPHGLLRPRAPSPQQAARRGGGTNGKPARSNALRCSSAPPALVAAKRRLFGGPPGDGLLAAPSCALPAAGTRKRAAAPARAHSAPASASRRRTTGASPSRSVNHAQIKHEYASVDEERDAAAGDSPPTRRSTTLCGGEKDTHNGVVPTRRSESPSAAEHTANCAKHERMSAEERRRSQRRLCPPSVADLGTQWCEADISPATAIVAAAASSVRTQTIPARRGMSEEERSRLFARLYGVSVAAMAAAATAAPPANASAGHKKPTREAARTPAARTPPRILKLYDDRDAYEQRRSYGASEERHRAANEEAKALAAKTARASALTAEEQRLAEERLYAEPTARRLEAARLEEASEALALEERARERDRISSVPPITMNVYERLGGPEWVARQRTLTNQLKATHEPRADTPPTPAREEGASPREGMHHLPAAPTTTTTIAILPSTKPQVRSQQATPKTPAQARARGYNPQLAMAANGKRLSAHEVLRQPVPISSTSSPSKALGPRRSPTAPRAPQVPRQSQRPIHVGDSRARGGNNDRRAIFGRGGRAPHQQAEAADAYSFYAHYRYAHDPFGDLDAADEVSVCDTSLASSAVFDSRRDVWLSAAASPAHFENSHRKIPNGGPTGRHSPRGVAADAPAEPPGPQQDITVQPPEPAPSPAFVQPLSPLESARDLNTQVEETKCAANAANVPVCPRLCSESESSLISVKGGPSIPATSAAPSTSTSFHPMYAGDDGPETERKRADESSNQSNFHCASLLASGAFLSPHAPLSATLPGFGRPLAAVPPESEFPTKDQPQDPHIF